MSVLAPSRDAHRERAPRRTAPSLRGITCSRSTSESASSARPTSPSTRSFLRRGAAKPPALDYSACAPAPFGGTAPPLRSRRPPRGGYDARRRRRSGCGRSPRGCAAGGPSSSAAVRGGCAGVPGGPSAAIRDRAGVDGAPRGRAGGGRSSRSSTGSRRRPRVTCAPARTGPARPCAARSVPPPASPPRNRARRRA